MVYLVYIFGSFAARLGSKKRNNVDYCRIMSYLTSCAGILLFVVARVISGTETIIFGFGV